MTIDHPVILETRHLRWPDEAACRGHAEQLAGRSSLRGAFIALQGGLGAGKTSWVRHLLRALGVQGRIKSPTYALAEPYDIGGLPVHHFDFYRFDDPREWQDAGLRDLFAAPGLKLAEWTERAAGQIPTPDLTMTLTVDDDTQARLVRLDAHTALGRELLT
jgi:tRNA threonylcarbamoyladenosine biosynthesis protein TsaE